MIAHAIAHIMARHGRGSQNGESTGGPVIFIGGRSGLHTPSSIAPADMPLGFLEMQRQSEWEADRIGIELAHRAGYDPGGLRRSICRTQPDDRKVSPVPSRKLRLAKMDYVLRSLPATPSASGQFERVLERTRELVGEIKTPTTPSLLCQ
jgi:predicted Zn-dependent protease